MIMQSEVQRLLQSSFVNLEINQKIRADKYYTLSPQHQCSERLNGKNKYTFVRKSSQVYFVNAFHAQLIFQHVNHKMGYAM